MTMIPDGWVHCYHLAEHAGWAWHHPDSPHEGPIPPRHRGDATSSRQHEDALLEVVAAVCGDLGVSDCWEKFSLEFRVRRSGDFLQLSGLSLYRLDEEQTDCEDICMVECQGACGVL